MKKLSLLVALIPVLFSSIAQTETINNNKIIKLVSAKVGDDIVISLIKTSNNTFDLSSDGIIDLSKNGVSQTVIKEMLAKKMVVGVPQNNVIDMPPVVASVPFTSKEVRLQEAMKNCYMTTDNIRNTHSFFSSRTPKDRSDDDRIFAFIFQPEGKPPVLGWSIAHNAAQNSSNDYMSIQMIYIMADNDVRKFMMNDKNYRGGGSMHSLYQSFIPADRAENVIAFLRKFSASNNTKIRFEGNGKMKEFDASNREKKAINDLLDLYVAMQ